MSVPRCIYRVVIEDGAWVVRREGMEAASRPFDTRDLAVQHAIALARAGQPSIVRAYTEDGGIQREWHFNDGRG